MTHFKAEEEKKREELTLQITNQKTQISDKENQIKNKNESISQMETEFQIGQILMMGAPEVMVALLIIPILMLMVFLMFLTLMVMESQIIMI